MSSLLFCLMGPTASGKTDIACELAGSFPFEIISVDSAMIYREMNIGTAKPSASELQVTRHHLIDIRDPVETYSAAEFCKDVVGLVNTLKAQGKIPLLTGGTMMYFNALQNGLSELPQADAALRLRLEKEAFASGWQKLHQKLVSVDPLAAARIHVHDTQRIQRALEVFYLTGKPLSSWLGQQKKESGLTFINLALIPQDRAWLHTRIASRFEGMLNAGLIDETVQLQRKWKLHSGLPSMRSVGYKQVLGFLQGEYGEAELRDKGIAATRQLAKRQLTWLRHWDDLLIYSPQEKTFNQQIVAKVREILDNNPS